MADILLLPILGLLFVIQFQLCDAEQGIITDKKVFSDQQVNLTCQLNSSGVVTWQYFLLNSNNNKRKITAPITTCSQDDKCESPSDALQIFSAYNFQATRSNDTSILSLTAAEDKPNFECLLGQVLVRTYRLTLIDLDYVAPTCNVAFSSTSGNGVDSVALSCEVFSLGFDAILTFEGIGPDIHDVPGSSQSSRNKTHRVETIYVDNFNNIHNASCNAYYPNILTQQSCIYPTIIKTEYNIKGNGFIVECDYESEVEWRLLDSYGREESITNRSWTRRDGRSLFIRNVFERDVGKVVVCQSRGDNLSNGTITFTVISKISRDTNEADSGDSEPVPGDGSPFLVPTLLFLTLWLITTAVGGVWFGCRHHRSNSSTWATRNASVPNAGSESNVNGGANDRETPLDLARVRVRGDPDTSNTNNSANNATFELQGEGTDENRLNRQSNNGSHLYFTLEKPSPSAESSRMASTSGIDRREDTYLASLNQPQSSHWQGYETVGESDKGAACSYDLGEYAEVGDHHIGRSLPDRSVRPSIPKKPKVLSLVFHCLLCDRSFTVAFLFPCSFVVSRLRLQINSCDSRIFLTDRNGLLSLREKSKEFTVLVIDDSRMTNI